MAAADLCDRLEATGLADDLGIAPVMPLRADHRAVAVTVDALRATPEARHPPDFVLRVPLP